jgi:hypothetical protein
MTDMQSVTEETLAALEKAQTNGILVGTGLYSYDLGELVRLIPVNTPFRDKLPRVASKDGAKFAIWRAILNVNNAQPRVTPGYELAGAQAVISEQDFQAQYRPFALDGTVSQDAYDLATGYDDPYAEQTINVLNQLLIGEDKVLIGGQSFVLPTPGVPTLAASTSGGSIATGTVYIAVAARTASGYYYGGNSQGAVSASQAVTGPTGKVTATLAAAVKGAVAYDWFYSTTGSAPFYYQQTTTVASAVFTNVFASNQNPLATPNLTPGIAAAVPTINLAADNGSCPLDANSNPAEVDGLIATLTADYSAAGAWVKPGTGTANPAVYIDGGGSALTLSGGSVLQITNLLAYIWNQVYGTPSALMMNAVMAQEIANLILAATSATTFLNTDASGRIDVVAGGRVGHVVNVAAGGVVVPIEVHPNVPPGTIIARTDRVPFPQANITNTLEVRTLRDYSQFDYGANRQSGTNGGPRKDFEIRSVEAFVNRAPVTMGILVNVA